MVSCASVFIHTVTRPDGAKPLLEPECPQWPKPALSFKLALTFCHNHLQSLERRCHGLFEGVPHVGHTVVVDGLEPLDTHAFQSLFNGQLVPGGAAAFGHPFAF